MGFLLFLLLPVPLSWHNERINWDDLGLLTRYKKKLCAKHGKLEQTAIKPPRYIIKSTSTGYWKPSSPKREAENINI